MLRRLAAFALAIGATGAMLAPATPAAEQGAQAPDASTAGTAVVPPRARTPADDLVTSTDVDAVPVGAPEPADGGRPDRVIARAAASHSVTISDFKFAPASITVNVGDTVTWTNKGPTAHTATGKDKSFDTGLLQKGETGSFTFKKAGTYAYICTPHPYMKATVKVVAGGASGSADDDAVSGGSPSTGDPSSNSAAESGGGGAGGGGGASGGSGGSGDSSSDDERLADTGTDTLLVAAAGLGLLLCGLGLRLLPRRA